MTRIEWVRNPDGTPGETWNPVTGCSSVSEGCRNCYAERFARRLAGRFGYPADKPFRVTLHPERLEEPLRWRKPRRVFVASMGDLFHEQVPDEWLNCIFAVMACAPASTFMVLTKRPRRMLHYLCFPGRREEVGRWFATGGLYRAVAGADHGSRVDWPLRNVWLGVTVENQRAADERVPLLLKAPAALRFVSCEPLLGSVELSWWLKSSDGRPGLDWVIVGGETGPGARPVHPQWVRNIRDQCMTAGTPFFFKSWGEWAEIYPDEVPRSGRWCVLLNEDGRWRTVEDTSFAEEPGTVYMYRIGKKTAGRLLDGREWNDMPRICAGR